MMIGGYEWLMMLFILGVPALLVLVGLGIALVVLFTHQRGGDFPQYQAKAGTASQVTGSAGPVPARYCSHCGTGLQADWSHCPNCGAPVGS